MNSLAKDYLKLHFIVLIFGFTAILGQLIQISSVGVVFYRTLIASIGLGLILKLRKISFAIEKKRLFYLLGIGVIMAIHWLCFFGSARLSTISISLVTFSTTSFFTSWLDPLINRKKVKASEVFLGLLVVVGIYFVFKFEFHYLSGIAIGLLAAVLSSFYSILNGRIAGEMDSRIINFYELGGAFLTILLLLPVFIPLFELSVPDLLPSGSDVFWLFVLGVACTVFPYLELIDLFRKMSVFTVNLSINMEPIYGILLAWLIFGEKEKMSVGFYLGGGLIILSLVLHPFLNKKSS
jgi:drug/metabolite transporter (DMT)-like permease